MGMIGLAQVMGDAGLLAADPIDPARPLAPRQPHFPAKAKHVIHIFANGGPSQVDTFDPKPMLAKYAGKTLPTANLKTERRTGHAFPSPFKFQKSGQSGIEVSELFAETAKHIDDICVVRSMYADVPNHEPSFLLMNTGDGRLVRPSLGSWVTYGLGTENQNLPGFVAMCPAGVPLMESQNWQCGFLPGVYQGSYVDTQHTAIDKLIENVRNTTAPPGDQRRQLDLLAKLNQAHQAARPNDPLLEARIQSFELAYRMQSEAADAFDTSKEPKHVLEAYGPGPQAKSLLLARRLSERGVRFVQAYYLTPTGNQPWDTHQNNDDGHRKLCADSDKATAALLADLKRTGLSTIRWSCGPGSSGGRRCRSEKGEGRPGPQPPRVHRLAGRRRGEGRGRRRGDRRVRVPGGRGPGPRPRPARHDAAPVGLDHEKLTYRYSGRDFRLTDVHGRVVSEMLA
jgi:hypothetical protein